MYSEQAPIWQINKEMIYAMILLFILICLFGCASFMDGLSNEDFAIEVVAEEVVEAIPIVVANPTFPGVLTAIISVVAGVAGAAFGAAGQKVAVKKKIAEGVLGKQATKKVDSL